MVTDSLESLFSDNTSLFYVDGLMLIRTACEGDAIFTVSEETD